MPMTMKRVIKFFLLALFLFHIESCLNDSSGRLTPGGSLGSPNTTDTQAITHATIVHDILGGALSATVKPEAFSVDTTESKAMTINVAFSSETSEIGANFGFKDEDGQDSLSITATGNVEEITTSATNSSLLNFSPLKVLIVFTNFQFTNACGAKQSFTGEMECRANGKYNKTDSNFKGSGTCVSGTEAKRDNLVDHYDNEDHQLNFSVNFLVDGNPFSSDSYTFGGQFLIDKHMIIVGSTTEQKITCQSNSN